MTSEKWDSDIDESQKAIIEKYYDTGGNVRLVAAPGTGKTRTMRSCIAYLIQEKKVDIKDIVSLSFTRTAAKELNIEVRDLFPNGANLPIITTLHSYSMSNILEHSESVDLPKPIRVADDWEIRWIINEDLKMMMKADKIKDIEKEMNRLQQDFDCGVDETQLGQHLQDSRFLEQWRLHRRTYGYILLGELVYRYKHALEQNIIKDYPQYFLVDEFQDLNPCDHAVIIMLSKRGSQVFASGDDDQNIYGFRGGDPGPLRKFSDYYANAIPQELKICYRCDGRILKACKFIAVKQTDTERLEKIVNSEQGRETQGIVKILSFNDELIEAENIARICEEHINKGIEEGEIIILLRSDNKKRFSSVLSSALVSKGLNVEIRTDLWGIFNYKFDSSDDSDIRRNARRFLALLRLLINRNDGLALWTFLRLSGERIGKTTLYSYLVPTIKKSQKISEVYNTIDDSKFNSCFNELNQIFQDIDVENSSAKCIINTLASDYFNDNDKVKNKVLEAFKPYFEFDVANKPLDKFMQTINSMKFEIEQGNMKRDKITIMTMHKAKGMSAKVVFIVAAEKEYIPGRALGNTEHEDEEKRLLYMSMSRAKNYLYLTHCNKRDRTNQKYSGRTGYNGDPGRTLSPFLENLWAGTKQIISEDGTQYHV